MLSVLQVREFLQQSNNPQRTIHSPEVVKLQSQNYEESEQAFAGSLLCCKLALIIRQKMHQNGDKVTTLVLMPWAALSACMPFAISCAVPVCEA